jgi:CRP-like cAMP-binding protein
LFDFGTYVDSLLSTKGGTRTAAAAALDVCHLYSLNRDDFDEVMGSFPEFKKVLCPHALYMFLLVQALLDPLISQ